MAAGARPESSLSDILLKLIVHLPLLLKQRTRFQYPATDPANATMRIALLQALWPCVTQLRAGTGMPSVQCWFSSLQRQNVLYLQKKLAKIKDTITGTEQPL